MIEFNLLIRSLNCFGESPASLRYSLQEYSEISKDTFGLSIGQCNRMWNKNARRGYTTLDSSLPRTPWPPLLRSSPPVPLQSYSWIGHEKACLYVGRLESTICLVSWMSRLTKMREMCKTSVLLYSAGMFPASQSRPSHRSPNYPV
jgi:hypothetical protein